jgi:phage-Barnase-EndoU-ColicinE5/D-RelE like nuclease1
MELEDFEDQKEYSQFKGKWKEAIAFLQEVEHGIAVAALYLPKIGEIDLVWGNYKENNRISSGHGLSKIIAKHPEVIENMQPIILNMKPTI